MKGVGQASAEMAQTIFCIVRKSPGLHPAVPQTRREREALLLSSEAGSALVAPDHSRASERSADRWPVRAESEVRSAPSGWQLMLTMRMRWRIF